MARQFKNLKRGYTKIPDKLIRNADLHPMEFRLICIIESFPECYASQEKIAEACGVSFNTAKKHLKALRDKGIVKTIQRYGSTNRYWVTEKDAWAIDGTNDPFTRPESTRTPVNGLDDT